MAHQFLIDNLISHFVELLMLIEGHNPLALFAKTLLSQILLSSLILFVSFFASLPPLHLALKGCLFQRSLSVFSSLSPPWGGNLEASNVRSHFEAQKRILDFFSSPVLRMSQKVGIYSSKAVLFGPFLLLDTKGV